MELDFKQVLEKNKALIWPEIESYLNKLLDFPKCFAIASKYTAMKKLHQDMVEDYPYRKGKYFRPSLVLLSAEAMGYPLKKALKTAAAMQTSEDWILIHDDIEDDSLERRGKPTLHQIYGTELAINAGDALHILMWKMLRDNINIIGKEKTRKISDEFYQMLMRTTFGQTVEIKWTKENKQEMTDEDLFLILDGKTSYYTVAGPMRLGAILGNANKEQLEKIWEFGQKLGRCFQIIDDLLDLTSDFRGLKKQTGNDIYEGKRTAMLIHLFRNVNRNDKTKLNNIMKKSREEKTKEEVVWVIKQMKKHDSLQYAKNLAEDLSKQALDFFEKELKFFNQEPARTQLKLAIDFIVNRDY